MNQYLEHEFAKWKASDPQQPDELTTRDMRRAAQKLKDFDSTASPKELNAEFAAFILQHERYDQ